VEDVQGDDFNFCRFLDGYYEKPHGCYKTMMGVNDCLIKEQNVCKRPQSV